MKEGNWFDYVMLGLMLAFTGFCCGAYVVTTIVDDKDVQVEAVERGLAEWHINAEGKNEWRWKEPS